jgi:hypothetical protein
MLNVYGYGRHICVIDYSVAVFTRSALIFLKVRRGASGHRKGSL